MSDWGRAEVTWGVISSCSRSLVQVYSRTQYKCTLGLSTSVLSDAVQVYSRTQYKCTLGLSTSVLSDAVQVYSMGPRNDIRVPRHIGPITRVPRKDTAVPRHIGTRGGGYLERMAWDRRE
eukprot:638029-Rhodomonas_salina.3